VHRSGELWFAKLFVQADHCDGPRYYHAAASSGRLTQALGFYDGS